MSTRLDQQTPPTKAIAARTISARLVIRGAVGGVVAGVVFGVLNMWFAASTGMPADMPLKMIATIVQGQSAIADGVANSALGLGVHMALSAAFGVGLAILVSRVASDAVRALIGLGYGLALYLVNFLIISPIAFAVFRDANQPLELTTHLVFGSVAVLFLLDWRAARTR